MLGGMASTLGKVVLQLVVGKLSGSPESTDCLLKLNVDMAISCDLVFELALINDLLLDVFQRCLHAFKAVDKLCV